MLQERPQLKTLPAQQHRTRSAADLDPATLGVHLESGACLTFEMITPGASTDRGGRSGRAVDGKVRLVEGLAMPREEDEFHFVLLQFR